MEILAFIVLLAAVFNFLLGLFVYLKNPLRKINRLFGISAFLTAFWIFPNFMAGILPKVFWLKMGYAFGALLPFSALLWILELCEKRITKLKIFLLFGLGLFFFIFSFASNLIVKNVKRIYLGGFEGETGPLFIPYWIYIFGILAFIIYTLFSSYYRNKNIKKIQIGYVLIGAILYISIVILVDFILTLFGIKKFIPLDTPSSLFLLFFTALAITRYHLFGIEVILTEILVGVIGILLVVQIFTAPSTVWRIVNGGIFVLYCIFGYLLIRGVFREIRRREELEKISQAKSEFISITSHQLRTPLSAIKGYLSMVLEGTYGGISERVKKVIENVYTANERLIKLVNSFLDVSRIELGREELKLERISIEDLISETVSEMEIEARKKNLYLKFERPKIALPKILIDRGRIKEVISNLIDNAIKYTQKGGITIKSQISNGKCQISISDTGEGLTKEEISRLFESFSRGTAGAKFWTEGVGLGLYVSKKFVELHGGKIWAESEGKGKGSTFYIELPIK
jgi:signal transduction histidine kinase